MQEKDLKIERLVHKKYKSTIINNTAPTLAAVDVENGRPGWWGWASPSPVVVPTGLVVTASWWSTVLRPLTSIWAVFLQMSCLVTPETSTGLFL